MAKTFIKELQEKIEVMEDKLELDQLEISVLMNEMEDMMRPGVMIMTAAQILLQMLMEQNVFERSKGISEKTKLHKDRLTKLLEINAMSNGIIDQSVNLKIHNNRIYSAYQQQVEANKKLKSQIEKLELTLNGI